MMTFCLRIQILIGLKVCLKGLHQNLKYKYIYFSIGKGMVKDRWKQISTMTSFRTVFLDACFLDPNLSSFHQLSPGKTQNGNRKSRWEMFHEFGGWLLQKIRRIWDSIEDLYWIHETYLHFPMYFVCFVLKLSHFENILGYEYHDLLQQFSRFSICWNILKRRMNDLSRFLKWSLLCWQNLLGLRILFGILKWNTRVLYVKRLCEKIPSISWWKLRNEFLWGGGAISGHLHGSGKALGPQGCQLLVQELGNRNH